MDAQNFRGGKIPDIQGYNPPIKIDIAEKIRTEMDGLLMKVIWKQGITVDKGELIRALQYDRDQYRIGFTNGYDAALKDPGWISVKDRLPEKEGRYLIYDGGRVNAAEYMYDLGPIWMDTAEGYYDFEATHWMPLPEAPKMKEEEGK